VGVDFAGLAAPRARGVAALLRQALLDVRCQGFVQRSSAPHAGWHHQQFSFWRLDVKNAPQKLQKYPLDKVK
jgi:hypothetical protein